MGAYGAMGNPKSSGVVWQGSARRRGVRQGKVRPGAVLLGVSMGANGSWGRMEDARVWLGKLRYRPARWA